MSHHGRKTSFRISWPLREEFMVTDGFSSQRDSNTELCRFCISLSIVLNKHSCCVAMNWTYTNTLRAQTTWWPFYGRHFGMYFLEWKCAWFDFIFSAMVSPIYEWRMQWFLVLVTLHMGKYINESWINYEYKFMVPAALEKSLKFSSVSRSWLNQFYEKFLKFVTINKSWKNDWILDQ